MSSHRRSRRVSHSNRPRHRRLRIEPLEDRRVLSVVVPQLDLFSFSPAVLVANQGEGADGNDTVRFGHNDNDANVAVTYAGPAFKGEGESGTFDEGRVRYILVDISFGYPAYYKRFPNDPSALEAVTRWEAGVRVQNLADFQRKWVGNWVIVYAGTNTPIDPADVKLTTDVLCVHVAKLGELPPKSPTASNLVLITHGWLSGPDNDGSWWVSDMANEMARYLRLTHQGHRWDVWVYDWREHSGTYTPLQAASRAAGTHGPALGEALGTTDYRYDHVHFIGHSAGTWVIDQAGNSLASARPEKAEWLVFSSPARAGGWAKVCISGRF